MRNEKSDENDDCKGTNQPLISNYGLYWRVEDVFWGAPRNPGSLLGISANAKKMRPIDFREQRGVYVLYSDFDLLYIGQVHRQGFLSRLIQHRKEDIGHRFNRFSWFGIRKINRDGSLGMLADAAHSETGNVLNHIEAILIYTAEPSFNRQGGKFGGKTQKYLQLRDVRLGPTPDEMIKDLYDKVNL